MYNLKKKLTYGAENSRLHESLLALPGRRTKEFSIYKALKALLTLCYFPMTTILIQVNFVLEKNC